MNFSLVFPTRERVGLLTNLLNSLILTSKINIEVLPVYDSDDDSTKSIVDEFTEKYKDINIKFLEKQRSKRLNEDYINYAARISTGKYVFVLNDDVEFLNEGWDQLAWETLENYVSTNGDGVVYGYIDDGLEEFKSKQGLRYCCFPIVSRKAFEVLGYAMPPYFNSWGADIYLYKIYQANNRILDLTNEVKILHVSVHNHLRPIDETAKNVKDINNYPSDSEDKIRTDIKKISDYLNPVVVNTQVVIPRNKKTTPPVSQPPPVATPPPVAASKPVVTPMPPVVNKPIVNKPTPPVVNKPVVQTPINNEVINRRMNALLGKKKKN